MNDRTLLPDSYREEVLQMLHSVIPDADDTLDELCLQETASLYRAGMSVSTLRLLPRGAVFAFAQRLLAERSAYNPDALRSHIRATLSRCLPQFADEDMINRCLMQLVDQDASSDPMFTGAIHQFAAKELMAEPPDDPLRQRLHDAALRHLPTNRPVNRDDLRLVALDALFDPSILPYSKHAGFYRLRLGLNGTLPHSCEEIAAKLHLPLTLVHAIESNALTALSSMHRRYRDA